MKFIDLINEDEQSEFDKVFKRTKTIFNAYRKGRIRSKSGLVVFSYELPEDSHISVSAGRGEGPTGLVICERIKIKEESHECIYESYSHFGDFIKRKFKNHGIDFIFNVYPEDITLWKPQPINENDDKRIKRARTIYKALKKGLLNRGEYGSIKYLLPDEYKVYVRSIDDVLVIRVGEEEDDNHVKFFFNDDDGTGDRPTKPGPKYYDAYVGKIWEKFFNNFDIKLIC